MLKNASSGEFIFFESVSNGVVSKVHSFVVKKEDTPYPYDSVTFEENLNSIGRILGPIWTESELANHEIAYMLNNSKGKSLHAK